MGPPPPSNEVVTVTTDGLSPRICSNPRPSRSMVPGRKLSITTSAQPASCLATPRPASEDKSTDSDNFDVLKLP